MNMLIAAAPAAAPAVTPPAYAAAAKTKLERDRKSFEAFRAVDQAEHDRDHKRRVTEAVATAEDNAGHWRQDVERLEPQAEAALAAFRAAEDRARKARENARQKFAAYEAGKGKVPVEEETDALFLADKADQVAGDAEQVMERLQGELAEADASLAEARDGLTGAERDLERVKKAAGRPAGKAPLTETTIRANASYLQTDEVWETLGRDVRYQLNRLARPQPPLSDQEWSAQMREAYAAMNGGGA